MDNEIIENNEHLPALPSPEEEPTSNDLLDRAEEILTEELIDPEAWKDRTGLSDETLSGALETIIFMSDRPVSLAKLKNLIDAEMPLKVIHDSLSKLQDEYEQKHHGIRLQEVAEGYQFRTKASYSKYVQDLFKVSALTLSPTALEVLAIIAYKQPVSRIEVEKIRGVDSSHIVRALMDRRLVKIAGRSDEMGRPVLYATTPEFMEVFNLKDLTELPPEHDLQQMSEENKLGEISDIKDLINSAEMFKFDDMEELDELQASIKSIITDTEFTASLKGEAKHKETEDGPKKRSAFELLEDFVKEDEIRKQNDHAAESELIVSATAPEIVRDLLVDGLNAPDEEDDETELLELSNVPLNQGQTSAEEEFDELFAPSTEQSKEELTQALDDAFDRIMSSKFDTDVEEDKDGERLIATKEGELNQKVSQTIETAKDLELDLGFMNDEVVADEENSSDGPSQTD